MNLKPYSDQTVEAKKSTSVPPTIVNQTRSDASMNPKAALFFFPNPYSELIVYFSE